MSIPKERHLRDNRIDCVSSLFVHSYLISESKIQRKVNRYNSRLTGKKLRITPASGTYTSNTKKFKSCTEIIIYRWWRTATADRTLYSIDSFHTHDDVIWYVDWPLSRSFTFIRANRKPKQNVEVETRINGSERQIAANMNAGKSLRASGNRHKLDYLYNSASRFGSPMKINLFHRIEYFILMQLVLCAGR